MNNLTVFIEVAHLNLTNKMNYKTNHQIHKTKNETFLLLLNKRSNI